MKRTYTFNEQGFTGFTSIRDKRKLSEVLYQSYRIMLIREASETFKIRLLESDEDLEHEFCMGAWLYADQDFFVKRCPIGTKPQNWPRHVNILDEHKEEIGVPVNDKNRLEINRAFKRGFNYQDEENNTYIIMAGETFTKDDLQDVLEAFNVPPEVDFVVKQNSALDPVSLDPKYFLGE